MTLVEDLRRWQGRDDARIGYAGSPGAIESPAMDAYVDLHEGSVFGAGKAFVRYP
jgi:hypothetical protein